MSLHQDPRPRLIPHHPKTAQAVRTSFASRVRKISGIDFEWRRSNTHDAPAASSRHRLNGRGIAAGPAFTRDEVRSEGSRALHSSAIWSGVRSCAGELPKLTIVEVSPARSVVPWSAQAQHDQDDADDRDDEPDGKPHSITRHETARDQIQALPGKYSANDQSDHANGD